MGTFYLPSTRAHLKTEANGDDTIHVTTLWEIEAYLLEPELIPGLATGPLLSGLRPLWRRG